LGHRRGLPDAFLRVAIRPSACVPPTARAATRAPCERRRASFAPPPAPSARRCSCAPPRCSTWTARRSSRCGWSAPCAGSSSSQAQGEPRSSCARPVRPGHVRLCVSSRDTCATYRRCVTLRSMSSHVVRIGPKGRVVVPAELRRQLGLEEGAELVARVTADRLVLEPRSSALRRLRSFFDDVPGETSLVDELVAERRREAGREA
jgi:AbrB family looped-hinge helix DNA binding protein